MRAALARTDHSLKKLCWSSASIAAVQRADEHRSCTCETRGVCNNHQRKRYVRGHREKTANYICTGSCPGLLLGSCTTTLHCFMHLESERGNGQAHEFQNAGVRTGCTKRTSHNRRCDRMWAQVYSIASLHSMASFTQLYRATFDRQSCPVASDATALTRARESF